MLHRSGQASSTGASALELWRRACGPRRSAPQRGSALIGPVQAAGNEIALGDNPRSHGPRPIPSTVRSVVSRAQSTLLPSSMWDAGRIDLAGDLQLQGDHLEYGEVVDKFRTYFNAYSR